MIEASLYNTPSGGYAADIGDDEHKSHGTPSHGCYQLIVERDMRHGVRTATASMAYNTGCYHLYLCSRGDELRTRNYATHNESTTVCYDVAPNIEKSDVSAVEVDRAVLALAGYPSIVQPCNHCSMLVQTWTTAAIVYDRTLLMHLSDAADSINDGSTVPEGTDKIDQDQGAPGKIVSAQPPSKTDRTDPKKTP